MSYIQILVAYDISNNKNRNKMFEELKDIGLHPIQKSIFWGNIPKCMKKNIVLLYNKYCDKENDRVIMIEAQLQNNLHECFGYKQEEFDIYKMYDIL